MQSAVVSGCISVCVKLNNRPPHHLLVALPAPSTNTPKHTNARSEHITYNQHQALRDTYALNTPTETVMMPGRLARSRGRGRLSSGRDQETFHRSKLSPMTMGSSHRPRQ
eukprot:g63377.t1